MGYDLEKYREKREKVLGVKKRGLSFAAMMTGVAVVILLGLGGVVIPKSIAFFHNRHLDDAIYKLEERHHWPAPVLAELAALEGVRNVELDKHGARIVVTYDRAKSDTTKLRAFFEKSSLVVVLLNQVSHSQRQNILEKEAAFGGER